MNYNKIWTKEKNDKLRNFIKEGKCSDYIQNYFGKDLEHHPNRKYCTLDSNILPFHLYNEMKINPIKINYPYNMMDSDFYKGETDYIAYFNTDLEKYVCLFMFYKVDNKIDTYNVIFTTEKKYNDYRTTLDTMLSVGFEDGDEEILKNIIESQTNIHDLIPIMKRLCFIISDMYDKRLKKLPLSIGNTDNIQKIKIYRNIISDTFPNFKESVLIDSNSNKYYLYQ